MLFLFGRGGREEKRAFFSFSRGGKVPGGRGGGKGTQSALLLANLRDRIGGRRGKKKKSKIQKGGKKRGRLTFREIGGKKSWSANEKGERGQFSSLLKKKKENAFLFNSFLYL